LALILRAPAFVVPLKTALIADQTLQNAINANQGMGQTHASLAPIRTVSIAIEIMTGASIAKKAMSYLPTIRTKSA
jgi:hypothetical protein